MITDIHFFTGLTLFLALISALTFRRHCLDNTVKGRKRLRKSLGQEIDVQENLDATLFWSGTFFFWFLASGAFLGYIAL